MVKEKNVKEKKVTNKKVNNGKENKKKKQINLKIIITLVTILFVIILAVFFITKLFKKDSSYKDKATYTTSFFIRNNKGKYALYNESGKKLSDFVYDSATSFINDSALVYKEKEGYAIINKKGKNIIPYGEYNYISSYGGLYKVRSNKGHKLLNSNGKVLFDSENIDINSYGEDYPFNIVTLDNKVNIVSYDGKTIKTFKQDKDSKTPTVNHVGEYATVYYSGKTVLFNSKTKKIITEFKSKTHYCVSAASEDGKILTLNSCASWYETLDEVGHKISVKGKVTDLSKECDGLTIVGDTVICSSKDKQYFVNIKGKKATLGASTNSRAAFIDDKNYVIRDNKTYKLEFYKNGKKVKTMDATLSLSGKMYEELYVLYVDNGYEYYSKDGKKAIKENFKYASSFDKNGLARVSKDENNYYLINKKGKKVSDEYSSISVYDKYYQVTNKKSLKGVINQKGKVVVPLKNTQINIRMIRDKYYAVVTKENGKYALYNLDKGKLIKEAKNSITISEHYIKVSGNKTAYYTYKDKLIFEE